MPGTDVARIWYGRVPSVWGYAVPAVIAAYAVAARSWLAVAWTALTFAQIWPARRGATRLTPDGIETGVLRRRRVPWSSVRAVRAAASQPRRVVAVLADGTEMPLRGVEWRAARAEGCAAYGSAQSVGDWARARGHDVALVQD